MPARLPPLALAARPDSVSLLGEPEAALVAEEKVGRRVVGHEQVDLAVVIEVGRDNPQAASLAVDDARLLGHVDETGRRRCERRDPGATAAIAGRNTRCGGH